MKNFFQNFSEIKAFVEQMVVVEEKFGWRTL